MPLGETRPGAGGGEGGKESPAPGPLRPPGDALPAPWMPGPLPAPPGRPPQPPAGAGFGGKEPPWGTASRSGNRSTSASCPDAMSQKDLAKEERPARADSPGPALDAP
jgi:hypothetical protein